MFRRLVRLFGQTVLGATLVLALWLAVSRSLAARSEESNKHDPVAVNADKMVSQGRKIFRFDTFGDEAYWGGELRLHEAIGGVALGGVGSGLSPRAALDLGLKVDVDALPEQLTERIRRGNVDLDSPATTL